MDCQLQDGRIARFTADVTAFPIASTMFFQIERCTNPLFNAWRTPVARGDLPFDVLL